MEAESVQPWLDAMKLEGLIAKDVDPKGKSSGTKSERNKDQDQSDRQVTVVIMSDRSDPIITTIGSMIRSASKPVHIILIGRDATSNDKIVKHFQERPALITALSLQDAEDDLVSQGMRPIWTWDEWHSSHDPDWKNENTIHVADWDDLELHEHELNHVSNYLFGIFLCGSLSYLTIEILDEVLPPAP